MIKLFPVVVLLGSISLVLCAPASSIAVDGQITTFSIPKSNSDSFQNEVKSVLPNALRNLPGTRSEFFAQYDPTDPNTSQFVVYGSYIDRTARTDDFVKTIPPIITQSNNQANHQQFNILANKVGPTDLTQNNLGLLVFFNAKDDASIPAVRKFLASAIPLVQAEPGTVNWIALEFPGTRNFAIFDSFPNEDSRNAHLNGKVAAALFAQVGVILDKNTPVMINKTTISFVGGNQ